MKSISTSFFKFNKKQILFVLFLAVFSVSYSQTYEWAKSISCSGADVGYSITEDAVGNVYITGYFSGTADFDPSASTVTKTSSSLDAFLAKFDSNGIFLWVIQLGSSGDEAGREILIDPSGNILITGYYSGTIDFNPSASINNLTSTAAYDVFLAKYDSNGNYIWAKSMGSNGNDYGIFLDLDSFGNIYLTGDFNGTIDLDPSALTAFFTTNGGRDAYIAKYDSNGNYIFGKTFGGTGEDSGQCLRVDNNDDFYVTGNFFNTVDFNPSAVVLNFTSNGGQDFFISKFDSNGSLLFCKTLGSTGEDYAKHLDLDIAFSPVICGYFSSTCDFDPSVSVSNLTSQGNRDVFIAKYSTLGNLTWAKSIGFTGFDFALSIIINNADEILIGGFFESTVDFDPSINVFNLTSLGSSDGFFAKYDTNGSFIFAKSIAGIGQNRIYSIFTNSINNIFITGFFNSTADFNPSLSTNNLTTAGGNEIFIGKYSSCNNPDLPTITANPASICTGNVSTLSITSGNLNSATNWHWYENACGTTFITTGTSILVSPTINTTYFVRGEGNCVSPGNCTSLTINVSSLTVANAGLDQNICTTITTLSANAPSTGSGSWSIINGTANITNSTSANTTITSIPLGSNVVLRWTISNPPCIVSTDDVTIFSHIPPTANAGSDLSICNSSITLAGNTPNSGTGTWSIVSGLCSINNINNPSTTISNISGTNLSLKWTINDTHCSNSDLVNISISQNNTQINPSGIITICADSTIVLDAGNNYTNYSWTPTGNSQKIIANNSGKYIVNTIDALGCSGKDSVTIVKLNKLVIKGNTDTIICSDQKIELSAIGANSYTWSPSLYLDKTTGDKIICQPDSSINYIIKGTINNCVGFDTLSITVLEKPKIELSDDLYVTQGENVSITALADSTVSWTPLGILNCDNCLSTNFTADTSIIIYAETVNSSGCISKDSIYIYVSNTIRIFIPNCFSPNNDITNDVFKIIYNGIINYKMEIFNRWGESIYHWTEKEIGWDGTYKGKNCPQDVYIYNFTSKDSDSKTIKKTGNITLIR